MIQKWLAKHRAAKESVRAARSREYALIQKVADAVLGEYRSLPDRMFHGEALPSRCEWIVNGIWIACDCSFGRSTDGRVTGSLRFFSKSIRPYEAGLTRNFTKQPMDAEPREALCWVQLTPTLQIDTVRPILELPEDASSGEERAAIDQNSHFLNEIADAVLKEYESLPYALFVDDTKLPARSERIVNGVWIAWDFDISQRSRNGALMADIDFHSDLPGRRPFRSVSKEPDDATTLREGLLWVQPNPVKAIDEALPAQLP